MTRGDTIAAVSTAPGEGGIGIVRISGGRAAEILAAVFVQGKKRNDFGCPPNHGDAYQRHRPFDRPYHGDAYHGDGAFDRPGNRDGVADKKMYYGHIVEPSSGETIDEALVVYMAGPRSYTGEDVCEIQCHGGGVPMRRILDVVCGLGAVPAQPGEFTKRAFLNGRLDLAQAGAVIDLIKSKTGRGYHSAKEQAEGRLSSRVREAREFLLDALAELAARIDYPEMFEEEAGGNGSVAALKENINVAEEMVAELLESAEAGRLVRDGIRAVIIGKPNSGKSSLFNALAREEAAIVTAAPGTTRDSLEIWLDIDGIPVQLFDTAGIRKSEEEIEALGIARTKAQYLKADLSILLLDGAIPLSEEDLEIAALLDPGKEMIVAINKTDLAAAFNEKEAAEILPFGINEEKIVKISLIGDKYAKEAVSCIEELLKKFVFGGAGAGASLLVTKAAHKGLLEKALKNIGEARTALDAGEAPEYVEINLRTAWSSLGEITGETATDEIIDRVFEEFCVGK